MNPTIPPSKDPLPPNPMVPIRLETAAGALVSDEESIPPFQTLPEFIIWGNRTFKYVSVASNPTALPGGMVKQPVYRECFTYVIPPRFTTPMAVDIDLSSPNQ